MPRAKKETEDVKKIEQKTVDAEKAPKRTVKRAKKETEKKKEQPLSEMDELAKQMKMEKEGLSEEEAEAEVREQTGEVDFDIDDVITGTELSSALENESDGEEEKDDSTTEDTEEIVEEEFTEDEEDVHGERTRRTYIASDTDVFRGRKVKRATENMKKGIYRNDFYVETVEMGEKVITEKDIRKQEYETLAQAAFSTRSGRPVILKGTLIAVFERANITMAEIEYNGIYNSQANVKPFKYFSVLIPASMMLGMNDPEKYAKEEMGIKGGLPVMLSKRIGMPVDFMVFRVKESEGIAYASRIHAMSCIANINYGSRNESDTPRLKAGTAVNATITGVNSNGIFVEAGGAETYIPQEELSYNRLGDCREEYSIGEKIQILIQQVESVVLKRVNRGQETGLKHFKIKASVKALKKNPQETYYNSFSVGDVCAGKVSMITDEGYFVELKKHGYQVFCSTPQIRKMPIVGSTVTVRIRKKVDEQKKTFGEIISVQ